MNYYERKKKILLNKLANIFQVPFKCHLFKKKKKYVKLFINEDTLTKRLHQVHRTGCLILNKLIIVFFAFIFQQSIIIF